MATITTTSNPIGIRAPWVGAFAGVAGSSPPLNQAIGKILFFDDFAVATKDAANESLVEMQATLPPGYFYRIQQLWYTGQSTGASPFLSGLSLAGRLHVTEAGVVTYQGSMFSNVEWKTASSLGAIATGVSSVTNNFQTWYFPDAENPLSQFLIDARLGTSEVLIDWVDISTDATTAVQVQWRLEVLQFTVEQGLSAGPNSPILTF